VSVRRGGGAEDALLVHRCARCGARFFPEPRACPRCGWWEWAPDAVPARGVVLAATELTAPAEGWSAPHRLVLVECGGEARVLAVSDIELPPAGANVRVVRDERVYRVVPSVRSAADPDAGRA
jgi:uncharacterized OB-fold protein